MKCSDCIFRNQITGECMVNFPADWGYTPEDEPGCEDYQHTGNFCVTKFNDGKIKLWNMKEGRPA